MWCPCVLLQQRTDVWDPNTQLLIYTTALKSNDCLNWSSDPYESQPLRNTFNLKQADLILQQWSAAKRDTKKATTPIGTETKTF